MSIENIKAFFSEVEKDDSLQNRLNALQKPEDCGHSVTGIVGLIKIAADAGFNFTREEYEKFEADILTSGEGELSEADLGNVAGGIAVFGKGGPFNNCKVALLLHIY